MKALAYLSLTTGLLLSGSLLAAPGLPAPYASSPTAKAYPNADVLVLSDQREVTLHPDGRVDEHVRQVVKVLTYEGMNEAGDPRVPFNARTQELKILKARTLTAEGLTVDAKPNSFTETTPFALAQAPAYADWREMVITHVGLDVNAVIEREYQLNDKVAWRGGLEGSFSLAGADPVLSREMSVTLPTGMTLQVYNLAPGNIEIKQEGSRWLFKARDLPGLYLDGLTQAEQSLLPRAWFTTYKGWADHANRLGPQVATAVGSRSKAMEEKVKGLVVGLGTDFEKVLKIHAFVVENINTVQWPLSRLAYVPRGAAEVFDTSYGHVLDKAVLLSSMLSVVGIQAPIAMTGYNLRGDTALSKLPCLSRLTAPILRVELSSGVVWLDPAAPLEQRSQRDFLGVEGLPLLPGFDSLHTMTPVSPESLLRADVQARMTPDGALEGEASFLMIGHYSPYYALQGGEAALKATASQQLGGILPGAEVSSVSLGQLELGKVVLKVAFKRAPGKEKVSRPLLTVGLPQGSILRVAHGLAQASQPTSKVLDSAGLEKVRLEIKLPPGLKPSHLPSPLNLQSGVAKVTQRFEVQGETLVGDLEISVRQREISLADWPAFRLQATSLMSRSAQTVVF